MTIQLGRMITDGIRRVLTRTGGLLLITLIGIQLLVQSSINTVVVGLFPEGPATEIEVALGITLPVSSTVASVIFAGAVVLSAMYFVVLARALTRPLESLSTIPAELLTHRIGRATLSMLVGGFVVGLAVIIGSIFLVLPGIFLSVCFLFFIFAVGVEDRGIIGALKRSWALSRGNRLKLATIVVFAGVFGFVISIVGTIFDVAGTRVAGELIVNTFSSIVFVFLYGMMAAGYLQVRDGDTGNTGSSGTTEPAGSVGS